MTYEVLFAHTLAQVAAVVIAQVTAGWTFVPPVAFGSNLPDSDYGYLLTFSKSA